MPIEISGTTGISGVDGSASAPALQGSDSNTGISFGSDTVNINTGGSARVTVDSAGSVGIGTSTPTSSFSNADDLVVGDGSGNRGMTILAGTSGISSIEFSDGTGSDATKTAGGIRYYHSSDYMRFNTGGGTERMRITSNYLQLQSAETAQDSATLKLEKDSASGSVQSDMVTFDVGGSGRGKIVAASSGSSNPAFSTYSDRRLKTNIQDYTAGYDKIKSIKVRSYDEVSNDDTKAVIGDTPATGVIGYIADEFQEVFPQAVRATKDQVDSDGKPIFQSLSDGLLTPHLVQALQSAIAKIETLETK